MASSASMDITYVPADCGSILPGKSKAPRAFQDVGIAGKLKDAGFRSVLEHHALESPAKYTPTSVPASGVRNEESNILVCNSVHEAISKNLRGSSSEVAFQLILGGECCMLPAIMSAFWKHAATLSPPKMVGLIYIDADLDLASPTDPSGSGSFASMNTTHLLQTPGALQSMKKFSRSTGEPVCDASNMVFFGTNMATPGNKREQFGYLFDHGYKVISSESVSRRPEQSAKEALSYLEERVDIILVHLDVDAIDPLTFPLANVPNFTGVTFEVMMAALQVLLGSDKVGGLTIAEVNPDHDPGLGLVDKLSSEIAQMLSKKDA